MKLLVCFKQTMHTRFNPRLFIVGGDKDFARFTFEPSEEIAMLLLLLLLLIIDDDVNELDAPPLLPVDNNDNVDIALLAALAELFVFLDVRVGDSNICLLLFFDD